MWKARLRGNRKKGMTLVEMMVSIGIIAVLVAIAIPSIIGMRRSLQFKKMNEYAKEVFLAAQNTLVERNAAGTLDVLRANPDDGTLPAGAAVVPEIANANFPAEDWSAQYCYTVTGTGAFELLLPAGSIDETVRSQNILVEYNPYTGNVYSVFYSESNALNYSNVTRDKTLRRKAMLGYYAGSGLSGGDALRDLTQPVVDLTTKGQEAILTVSVPIPDNYLADAHTFANAMRVSALIEGELFGGKLEDGGGYWFEIPQDQFGEANVITGNTAQVSFVLDSLKDQGSFASLAQNNRADAKARNLGNIQDETSFKILPGDNVTITVSITIEGLSDVIEYSDVIVSGLNPMFGAVQEVIDTTGGTETVQYDIYLENGRHLQNLNAIAPQIADKVKSVYFSEDIYWNETQDYYTNKYVTQSAAAAAIAAGQSVAYTNSENELPGRGLPYFVPITSPNLFGSAYFYTETDSSWIQEIFPFLKGLSNLPLLTDTDTLVAEGAEIYGGKHKVLYLDIDADKTDIRNANYYAYKDKDNKAISNVGKDQFTGLFSYCESNISSLYVVNPSVAGVKITGNSATGGMVGACGPYAFLYDCGIYIDTEDKYFSRADMPNYSVTGHNAVGGLVGYAKSHKSVGGGLMTNDEDVLAFSQCFAAIPVDGTMVNNTDMSVAYGYSNGVGGIVGVSILSNFYNCYASGDVSGEGSYTPGDITQIIGSVFKANGVWSRGIGGFVGTSHGTRYSNCFATGDVKGTSHNAWSINQNGVGGFIGVAFLDESFKYGTGNAAQTVTQSTKFSSCYCTGVSTVENTPTENYCGRILRLSSNEGLKSFLDEFFSNRAQINLGDYYTSGIYRVLTILGWRNYDLSNYIYKDSYYLNQYVDVSDDRNSQSNFCAQVVQYQDLQNLKKYQAELSKIAKGISVSNAYSLADQAKEKMHDRYEDYLGGFDANGLTRNWHNPGNDGFVTHPYSLNIGGQYPFTKLNGMDYYGDWPSYLPSLALAYYEEYRDSAGKVTKGYYLDRDRTSTLKNGKEGDETYTVIGDGYVILCSGTVENLRIDDKDTGTTKLRDWYPLTIGNVRYNAYELKPEAMKAAAEETVGTEEFYSKLTITTSISTTDGTPFEVYFNPRFALTQVNPSVANNGVQHNKATKPASKPSQIYIRSARQLREIGLDSKYWGEGYHYFQLLDIDAEAYDWQKYLEKEETDAFTPIGSVTAEGETAFQGSYNGGAGYVKSARISNVDLNAKGQRAYGLFGLIGKNGSVSSVTVDVDKTPASTTETNPTTSIHVTTSVGNMGMLAGVNRGKISAVTIAADNALTVTAQEAATIRNFGMLAGLNNGSITGCTVNAPKPIQADVTGAMGGLVGLNTAVQSEGDTTTKGDKAATDPVVPGAIDGCTVTIDTIENTNASTEGFTGGIVGKLESGTFKAIVPTTPTEPTEPVEPVETAVAINIGSVIGKGYVGGFAGYASGNPGSIEAVEITNVAGAAAGGVIGKAEGLTLSGSDVTVKGQVKGQTHAGGFAAQVTKSGSAASELKNCNVTLMDSVTVTAEYGTAAGFAAELNAAVMESGVFCRGSGKVTISGTNAAGFAGNAYLVRSSSFSGKVNIEGRTYAAGFANQITNAQGNVVAPVLMDSKDLAGAFTKGKNADLIISAPNAAGFVNTVPEDAEVSENAALGTITGTNAAGFAGSNNGIIARCMANVTVSGGVGFVAENTENVEACYVWYAGEGVKNSFVFANTGTVNGCYAAPLGAAATFTPAESTGTFTNCYNVCSEETASPIEGIHNKHFENMVGVGASQLGGKNLGWTFADVAKKYPYDGTLSKYAFPMLLKVPQYGNWKNGPIYAYGVVYYEEYDDGTLGYQIVELSDPNITEEGEALSLNRLPDSESVVKKAVTKFGYGVFYRKSSQISVMQGNTKLALNDVSDETDKPEELTNYVFKVISNDASCLNAEGELTGSLPLFTISGANDTAEVNPYFASAIKVNPDESKTNEPFHIHTPKQLQNVAGFPKEDFVICRNLDMSGSTGFVAIDNFSGNLTARYGAEITGLTGGSLFGSVAKGASISNLTLKSFNMTGSLFGDVSENASISNLTLMDITAGSLFGDVTGSAVTGLSLDKSEAGVNSVGSLFGKVSGNASISTVNLKNFSAGTLFGNVTNSTISGLELEAFETTTGTLFGNVSDKAEISNLSLKNFNASGALFDTVNDATIQNVTVSEATVTVTISSDSSAGLFANIITGGSTIDTCQILGEAQPTDAAKRSRLTVTGGSAVGVLVGEAVNSTISDVQIQGVDLSCSGTEGAHIGGAVGFADGADGKTAASYSNCSAAVDMVIPDSAIAGQFVGYVAYGKFENCKGLKESNYLFLGGINENTQNVEDKGYYYYDGDPSKQTVPVTRNEEDGSYTGFTGVQTLKEYNATLSECYYLDAAGEQKQEITSRVCYTLADEVPITPYTAELLASIYTNKDNLTTNEIKQSINGGEWPNSSSSKKEILNHFVKPDASVNEYVPAYAWRNRYYQYCVGTENGTALWSGWNYETCNILYKKSDPSLEPGSFYMICSGDDVLGKDGFETWNVADKTHPNLKETFVLEPDETNKFLLGERVGTVTVTVTNGAYQIEIDNTTYNIQAYELTNPERENTQTLGTFKQTAVTDYSIVPDPNPSTRSMDHAEAQFSLRPIVPEAEPTESESETTILETTVPGMTVPETTEGDTPPTSQPVGDSPESETT